MDIQDLELKIAILELKILLNEGSLIAYGDKPEFEIKKLEAESAIRDAKYDISMARLEITSILMPKLKYTDDDAPIKKSWISKVIGIFR